MESRVLWIILVIIKVSSEALGKDEIYEGSTDCSSKCKINELDELESEFEDTNNDNERSKRSIQVYVSQCPSSCGNKCSGRTCTTRSCSCSTNCCSTSTNTALTTASTYPDAMTRFLDSAATFSINYFKYVYDDYNVNFFVSPFLQMTVLTALGLECEGKAYQQALQLTNLKNKEEIRSVLVDLATKTLTDDTTISTSISYYNEDFPLNSSYVNDRITLLNASNPEVLDVSQPREAAQTIYQWVSDNTLDLIQETAPYVFITTDTAIKVLKSLYYMSNFTYPFLTNNTKILDFFVESDKTVAMNFMYQKNYYNYGESQYLDCKIIDLPYEGKDYKLQIALPNKVDGLSDLISLLAKNITKLIEAQSYMTVQNVKVWLPRIDTNTSNVIPPKLEKYGITEIFNPCTTDLKSISAINEPCFMNGALENTYILVDEGGTKAAVNTDATYYPTSSNIRFHNEDPEASVSYAETLASYPIRVNLSGLPEFRADHPFAYTIFRENIALFSGVWKMNRNDYVQRA